MAGHRPAVICDDVLHMYLTLPIIALFDGCYICKWIVANGYVLFCNILGHLP